MRTTWIVVCGICLSMASLWLPSEAGADPTTRQCADIGDKIWGQRSKELPKNQSTIDMLMKLAVDCPALAGSMGRLANSIKADLQKQADASRHVKKAGEKYQDPAYNPGGSNTGGWYSAN
jgi:hypothetical protein